MAKAAKKEAVVHQVQLTLEERIEALKAECNAFIDKLAAEKKLKCGNIPIGVLRNLLTRQDSCVCRIVTRLIEEKSK